MSDRLLLALNLGSATIKAATFALRGPARTPAIVPLTQVELPATSQHEFGALLDRVCAAVPDLVVHRVVHGGDRSHGIELDDAALEALQALAPLAPLHQPPALALVREARRRWPQARHGAAFDTCFHGALAAWSRRLPIPQDWDRQGLRRYGFHGLSFASALRLVAEHDPRIRQARAVFVHLGGGCSLSAVERGISRDTTMATTPLGGVPGPKRCGDLDPGLVLHLLRQDGMDAAALEHRLSRESGLSGIAGNGDLRALLVDPDPRAGLAVEQFVMRIAQAIASMATAIGGLEHLVFSGGIGHGSAEVRARIAARLAWLQVRLDVERNQRGELRIDRGEAPAVWNVAVDEQRELAESALSWL